ncbi:MAG TPA: type II toxin-antitoxin system VapC family toxin [Stellaceae bacterium]|jgi:ribonuclease VapC|nr:type II toxin-antitoxin system VapC family toxin [Stellaceae bacterium]
MVIDSSAMMSILLQESDAQFFADAIERTPTRIMSAATLYETGILIQSRRGDGGAADLDLLVENAHIEIRPFDLDQARIAREAYRRYGRGNHRAGLNFGDCFAYALAKVSGEPLLFKGGDFSRTDIASAS